MITKLKWLYQGIYCSYTSLCSNQQKWKKNRAKENGKELYRWKGISICRRENEPGFPNQIPIIKVFGSFKSQYWSWFSLLLTVLPTLTQVLVISHFPHAQFSPYFNSWTTATAQVPKCKPKYNTNFKFNSLFYLS